MRHDGTDSDRDISLGRNDLPKSSLLRILSGQTVEISNRDLEPLRNGEFYARLKPRVIEWLAPIWKEATQLHASQHDRGFGFQPNVMRPHTVRFQWSLILF
jgi:hypothetical protein